MSWLYTPLAEAWSDWLPPDAVNTAKYAGYYTTLTPDGTRIVSLNTNLGCNNQNMYVIISCVFASHPPSRWLSMPTNESANPDLQLSWFAQVMQDAEIKNDRVYLIMHIEAGDNCDTAWWTNYFKIIVRYQNNIIAAFAGHDHADMVHTTFVADMTYPTGFRPMLTTYFAGSVTPYLSNNPGFRVYEVDAKTKV